MISSTASSEMSTLRARSARSSAPISIRALAERAGVEARGVEGLQDIVTGRGEETGLREVGCVRLVLGSLECGVQPLQFRRAFLDPPLEHLVCGGERFFGLNRLRHVGIGGHDPAVRKPRRAHLDDAVGREQAQPVRSIVIELARDSFGYEVLRISWPVGAPPSVEAHDLVEPQAMAQHGGRQIEKVERIRDSTPSAPDWRQTP